MALLFLPPMPPSTTWRKLSPSSDTQICAPVVLLLTPRISRSLNTKGLCRIVVLVPEPTFSICVNSVPSEVTQISRP